MKVSTSEIAGYITDPLTGPQVSLSDKFYVKNCSLDVYGNHIQNVADPVGANDAFGKTYADNRYYLNTVPLNSITIPSASVSLNSQKIINLADATTGGDALNRTTADGRYYLNTVTLNSITAPSASLSINSQKIVNLLDQTLAQDAVTLNYLQTNNYTKTQTTALTVNSFAVPIASFSMNS